MRTSTTDPITLEDVTNLDNAPYVIEGRGDNAIKVYFGSEQNRDEYHAVERHGSGAFRAERNLRCHGA